MKVQIMQIYIIPFHLLAKGPIQQKCSPFRRKYVRFGETSLEPTILSRYMYSTQYIGPPTEIYYHRTVVLGQCSVDISMYLFFTKKFALKDSNKFQTPSMCSMVPDALARINPNFKLAVADCCFGELDIHKIFPIQCLFWLWWLGQQMYFITRICV